MNTRLETVKNHEDLQMILVVEEIWTLTTKEINILHKKDPQVIHFIEGTIYDDRPRTTEDKLHLLTTEWHLLLQATDEWAPPLTIEKIPRLWTTDERRQNIVDALHQVEIVGISKTENNHHNTKHRISAIVLQKEKNNLILLN